MNNNLWTIYYIFGALLDKMPTAKQWHNVMGERFHKRYLYFEACLITLRYWFYWWYWLIAAISVVAYAVSVHIILFCVQIIILNSMHQIWSFFGTSIFNVLDTCDQPANPWFLTLIPRKISRNGIRLWERYRGSSTQHTRDESREKSISLNLLNLFHDIYALHNGGIWFNVNIFQ